MHTRRWGARKEASHRQVFIDLGPMDPVAGTCQFPPVPLFGRCMQQPRVPGKWDTDCPAVEQVHHEKVVCTTNVPHARTDLKFRSSHAIPSFGTVIEAHPKDVIVKISNFNYIDHVWVPQYSTPQ